ncbi:hypothetical protein [Streptomyces sp. ALB3]|uniref:hypothetical protein n=1 Tax=Streptomyces sp. ALB3 TaxID=3374278 RepID=UPI0037B18A7A
MGERRPPRDPGARRAGFCGASPAEETHQHGDVFLGTVTAAGSRTTLRGPDLTYTITGSVELPADLGKKALYADPGTVIAPPWKAAAGRRVACDYESRTDTSESVIKWAIEYRTLSSHEELVPKPWTGTGP